LSINDIALVSKFNSLLQLGDYLTNCLTNNTKNQHELIAIAKYILIDLNIIEDFKDQTLDQVQYWFDQNILKTIEVTTEDIVNAESKVVENVVETTKEETVVEETTDPVVEDAVVTEIIPETDILLSNISEAKSKTSFRNSLKEFFNAVKPTEKEDKKKSVSIVYSTIKKGIGSYSKKMANRSDKEIYRLINAMLNAVLNPQTA
jgi:hypothetical protein